MATPRLREATIIPIYLPAGYITRKWKRIEDDLEVYLRGPVRQTVRNWLYLTITGWKEKPFFRGTFTSYGGQFMSMYVYPVGGMNRMKWIYVSKGVKGHYIRAVRAPQLVYNQGYRARTQPEGRWGIAGGGRTYGPQVKRKQVWWPGIEPRNFEDYIVKKIEKEIVLGVRLVIVRAVLK